MATVGTVEVIASIDTSAYKKGAAEIDRTNDRLEGSTSKSSSGMNKALIGVGKVGFAALATAAVSATAMVVKNIDGAIQRIDALVAFPRVLKSLGISGEEAEAATRKLSESLQGLPTSLSQGTQGVQGFITAGLDVNRATDAFLAFNNAMLAAGVEAGTADQTMRQFNQALSRGRIDGAEWNSIAANIPTVLQALSNESGKTTAELRELYSQNPQGLIDEIIRLNEEGSGAMSSLEEQARNATGGIGTSFANLDNAIQRAMENVVRNIGGGDLEAGQRRISDVINNFSKSFGDVLIRIGDGLAYAGQAVQVVIGWLQPLITYMQQNQTVADVLKTTLMVIGGILTGVVLGAIIVVVGAAALLTGAINVLVSVFTWLMQTAIKVWQAVSNWAVLTWNLIKATWSAATGFFSGIYNSIVSFFSQLPGRVGGAFNSAWSSARGAWSGAVGFFSGIVNGIISFFASIPGRIRGFFVDAFNAIRSISWVQVGADIIAGIVRGLNPGSITAKMKEIASSAMDTVKSFLGIKSPSRVFMEIGGDIMAGWAKGLDARPVVGAMNSATSQLMRATSPLDNLAMSGSYNVTGGGAFDNMNGSNGGISNNINTVNIASEVDGERWLRRLNGNQEIVSNGLVPTQSYM